MAAVAVIVEDLPSRDLLRVESEFSVAPASLQFASRGSRQNQAHGQKNQTMQP